VAVDRDRAALAIFEDAAGHLGQALGRRIVIERRAELLRDTRLEPATYDLVVAGNVLNELDPASRLALVERALAGLADGGALILIEPALRQTTRDLHRVRDDVLAAGLAHVFAPCTRATAPCPALARERDWCHEDRPLALPPRAARLAQATGLRDSGMKFSYLVLRRAADPLVAAPARAALRVVSEPKRLKGRRECIGCGDSGWVSLRLLSRRRSAANRAYERLRRGDVVLIDRADPGDGIRDIREDEQVDRVAIERP
jgi:ribosomal protein RSM22 (predicted rRNA methylase)